MEQGSAQEPLGAPVYKVVWHPKIKDDFSRIPPSLVSAIASAVEHRLSRAPEFIGQPLKGTTNLLWRISFSKYRIVYTLNSDAREVWVLSAQKREIVYRDIHIQSLLKLAVAIQQKKR